MLNVRVAISIAAPIDRVWAAVTDYPGYARFPGVTAARVRTPGAEHPAGVGAVREISAAGTLFVEEIVEFEPPLLLGYRIVTSRPIPIAHELGCMRLTPLSQGTALEWESRGAVAVPIVGALLDHPAQFIVRRSFMRILHWLKHELECA